ncbi:hypothetical protein SAZ11_62770 [Streptomyces sp. FXJ1.4098]|nr:hypothetical protein [Streptomyces sp. FXJ1.4098]
MANAVAEHSRRAAAEADAVAKAAAHAAEAARAAADGGAEAVAEAAEAAALRMNTETPWLSRHLPTE